ncbi:Glycosyltransferase involved in cell wall bisynthesis [Cohaesibacter sp. ES.047]|uniref:glycosyltransferase family 2 protein n=1 Tax=Cohaesibacter sp. ES.047 TaxID=1798205 RepID=UPI000BB75268|nr:glycosyltransferase family 2 protein [Cohaesibacter sp. ES.047]SNY89880.1 Glycosyltransferase involved in cell wall bisynthesis [Cohaesibacter sp. ES.047]SNY91700.1 Glycosyltransferase involved in cell wall bisynthesis [Cohaesibacter sp. ES.047]
MRFLILLATYNGLEFLDEQLESILDQNVDNIDLLISDDGSTDGTWVHLEKWASRWSKGHVKIIEGPKLGFAENFRRLLLCAPDGYDYYAFSDQDDVWLPNKLLQAQEKIALMGSGKICLYGGRTRIVDSKGIPYGQSPLMSNKPCFGNALVQSIVGGNTMVFNFPTLALLQKVSADSRIVSHDWWAYIWVSGAGGNVFYDKEVFVEYRQHEANLVGNNSGLSENIIRFKMLLNGRFKTWTDLHLSALQKNSCYLTVENAAKLDRFVRAREGGSVGFALELMRRGFRRQTLISSIALYAAALFRRI